MGLPGFAPFEPNLATFSPVARQEYLARGTHIDPAAVQLGNKQLGVYAGKPPRAVILRGATYTRIFSCDSSVC